MIFYKSLQCLLQDNKDFTIIFPNSELKTNMQCAISQSRFHLLNRLQLNLTIKDDIVYFTGWINPCVTLNSFCIDQNF